MHPESELTPRHYLQVIKAKQTPKWPRPEEDLVVGSQELENGFVQYWAYKKDLGKDASDIPYAEVLASENPAPRPAILIDQPTSNVEGAEDESREDALELILVKGSHAWGYTSSSLQNLEDNLSALLDYGKRHFDFEVEHFMTTDRVSEDVEKKLDSLEDPTEASDDPAPETEKTAEVEPEQPTFARGAVSDPQELTEDENEAPAGPHQLSDLTNDQPEDEMPKKVEEERESTSDDVVPIQVPSDPDPIRHVSSQVPSSGIYSSSTRPGSPHRSGLYLSQDQSSSSKLWLLLPIILLLGAFGGVIAFKDQLYTKFIDSSQKAPVIEISPSPTSVPEPTAKPLPEVDREKYKIRVLNGTTTPGAARVLGDKLKELGWEVVRVGNNTDQEVAKTQIRTKKGLEDVAAVLTDDIKAELQATSSADLKISDGADAEIIIGAE